MPAIPVIIEQHAGEAAFLWLLRDTAVSAPHYSMAELAKLDNRVEAHIDGLRIAGSAGWELCQNALEQGDGGEVFAAAVLAFESCKVEQIQTVLKAATATPELSRGLISALGWLPFEHAENHVKWLAAADVPSVARMGIAAAAVHRKATARELGQAIVHAEPLLRVRALRAVGELGLVDFLPVLRKNLDDQEESCRFWAAWSAALLVADTKAIEVLKQIVESNSTFAERALLLAIRRMELPTANAWRTNLAQRPNALRLAIIAVGAIGDPVSMPWLIEQMKIPELRRIAGEAFTMMTGIDLALADLETEWPEGFASGPTENPEDENVAMDRDEKLPWPNPSLIQTWWDMNQGEFQAGTRHLLGQRITPNWLMEVLRTGRQRQRAAAALELAMSQPGQPLFEVRAPGFRQQKLLAADGPAAFKLDSPH